MHIGIAYILSVFLSTTYIYIFDVFFYFIIPFHLRFSIVCPMNMNGCVCVCVVDFVIIIGVVFASCYFAIGLYVHTLFCPIQCKIIISSSSKNTSKIPSAITDWMSFGTSSTKTIATNTRKRTLKKSAIAPGIVAKVQKLLHSTHFHSMEMTSAVSLHVHRVYVFTSNCSNYRMPNEHFVRILVAWQFLLQRQHFFFFSSMYLEFCSRDFSL